jgi:endonuclease-3
LASNALILFVILQSHHTTLPFANQKALNKGEEGMDQGMLSSQPEAQKGIRLRKRTFHIEDMLNRIEQAVQPYPKAMLFELFERGFQKPFEILVACMISIRTLDEVSLKVSLGLFSKARTPLEISKLGVERLDQYLHGSTYHRQKAERILQISKLVQSQYDGELPCDESVLLSLPGVGPKTANLVLGITCHQAKIGVDIHVHRVTNRWGYVQAKTPLATEVQLMEKLPHAQWVRINALLVPFGKHICTGVKPHCSTCPVLAECRQVGVTEHR